MRLSEAVRTLDGYDAQRLGVLGKCPSLSFSCGCVAARTETTWEWPLATVPRAAEKPKCAEQREAANRAALPSP